MRPWIIVGLVLAWPVDTRASSSVVFGADSGGMIGADVFLRQGERPAGGGTYQQWGAWWRMRMGWTSGSRSELGSRLGFEGEVGLGYTQNEQTPLRSRTPATFMTRLGIPIRFYTFNRPFLGAAVAHVSLEFATGGGRWWSKGGRLSWVNGVRLLTRPGDLLGVELDYALVPLVLAKAPGVAQSHRMEHRFWLSLGRAPWGIGLRGTVASTSARRVGQSRHEVFGDWTWGIFMAYRVEED